MLWVRRIFKWLLLGFAGLLALVAATIFIAYVYYSDWQGKRLDDLTSGSKMAETKAGLIEYILKGDNGPVILFLHGTPGGYDSAPAAGKNFRVLAPSRPGYLRTPLETGRTPSEQARAYAALLDTLGIKQPVLVMATSGGGPSGIAFAAMYPDLTAGLLALEAISQPHSPTGGIPIFLQYDFLIWALFNAVHKIQGDAGLVRIVVPDPANQELILNDPEKIKVFIPLVWSIWPVSQRNTGWQNDTRQFEHLALPSNEVSVPTLIVHGTDDLNVPFTYSEKLASQIPSAEFYAIDGADHMMMLSHREKVDEAIETFLLKYDLEEFQE